MRINMRIEMRTTFILKKNVDQNAKNEHQNAAQSTDQHEEKNGGHYVFGLK